MANTTPLDKLIAELERIKTADGKNRIFSYSLKLAACIAFTDEFIPQIKGARSELTEYVSEIRKQAIALKRECDRVERKSILKAFNFSAVQEAFEEIVGLVENVCLLLNPDLVEKVDSAAL